MTTPRRARLSFDTLKAFKPQAKRFSVWDTEIPGFMAYITPLGGISFYVSYKIAGRRAFYSIGPEFKRMSSIRAEAKAQAARAAQGIDIHAEKRAKRVQVKEQIAKRKAAKKNTLKTYIREEYALKVLDHQGPSGMETHRKLLQVWASLLDIDLKAITGEAIEAVVHARRQKVGVTTVVRDLTVLRAVFNHAVDGGTMPANPMPSRKRLLGKIPDDKRVRFLADDERERLNAALDDEATPDYLRALVRLLLGTGMRRGEAFSLRWADVDLAGARITLRAATTKTKQTRHIPLNHTLVALLREWHAQDREVASMLVIPNPTTGKRLVTVKKGWAGLMQRAEIENFRLHDCRHDFASRLAMAGRPILEIKELLGHSSVTLTERYSHLSAGHLREAVEVVA
jgi:integrase